MSETEQKKVEEQAVVQDDSDDEHEHDENCNHEHGHEHGQEHGEDDDGKKANRGEKKFKKAMLKLGMKPMTGVNRVTISRGKSLLLYIDNPEILKSPTADNSYIIFGEPKINDFAQQLAQSEANKFRSDKPGNAVTESSQQDNKAEITEEQVDLSEEGLDPEKIKMVMEHGNASKANAIKALRQSNGDEVNAILELNK